MNSKRIKLGLWIIQISVAERFRDELEGDLFEIYDRQVQKKGENFSRWMFLINAIISFRLYRFHKIKKLNSTNMFRNYLLVTFRHSQRHKVYSFVNLFSLIVGLLTCFCIALFIKGETEYDRFHEKGEDLYRLVIHDGNSGMKSARMSTPFPKLLKQIYPEVTLCSFGNDDIRIAHKGENFISKGFYWADSTLFQMFSFELISGNPNALASKTNVVITRSLSERLFGHTDVVGEILPIKIYDGDLKLDMIIGCVVEDPPSNSHIQFELLGSMSKAEEIYSDLIEYWGFNWLRTYAHIPEEEVTLIRENHVAEFNNHRPEETYHRSLYFQPITEVYLDSKDIDGTGVSGNKSNLQLFGVIGLLVLLISIFNYVNLSTTRLLTRKREVGLRKSIGAQTSNIVVQVITESILFCAVSAIIAAVLLFLIQPYLSKLIGLNLDLNNIDLFDLVWVGLSIILLAFLSGLYPAYILAKAKPGNILEKTTTKNGIDSSKVLLTFQYAATILLITSSMIVYHQYDYLRNYNLGINTSNLLNLKVNDKTVQAKIPTLKNRLLTIDGISSIAATSETFPGKMQNHWGFSWSTGQNEENEIEIVGVDEQYFEVIQVPFVDGNNFTSGYETDSARSVILNKAGMDLTNMSDIIGQLVTIGGVERQVIGVVDNYHMQSLHNQIKPTAYIVPPAGYRVSPDNILLRFDVNKLSHLLAEVETTWKIFSSEPLVYSFVDDDIAQQYVNESRLMYILQLFTIIAISIALSGLFGLVTFQTRQRFKEISVRKVLGANNYHLYQTFSSIFIKLYLLAAIVGLPLALYFGLNWLENYPIRIDMDISIFLLALTLGFVVSIAVVIGQVARAIDLNPGEILKD